MDVSARTLIIAAALITLAISPAAAGHPLAVGQHWGRWIGYGWGEGYHARDEVPPRRPHSKHAQRMHFSGTVHGAPIVPPPPSKSIEVLPLPLPPPDAPLDVDGSR